MLALFLAACGSREPFHVPVPLGLDLYTRVPEETPLTRERVGLGRRLFFDPSLSADGSVSCSSCHRPEYAFADTVAVSAGVYGRHGRRNAPSLLNVTYRERLFWDGRSEQIEEQVLLPLQSSTEMDRSLDSVTERLAENASYRRAFQQAFDGGVTTENLSRALASFLRTLRSGDSPYDRFRNGDREALTAEARRGFALFTGRAGCSGCHGGPNLTDGDFHNTGVTVTSGDPGRFAVTGDVHHLGAFRTPSLRNIALTAPYMHDGSFATLEEVIDFYDRGGKENAQRDELIRPRRLTADEKHALVAFLRALTGAQEVAAGRLRTEPVRPEVTMRRRGVTDRYLPTPAAAAHLLWSQSLPCVDGVGTSDAFRSCRSRGEP